MVLALIKLGGECCWLGAFANLWLSVGKSMSTDNISREMVEAYLFCWVFHTLEAFVDAKEAVFGNSDDKVLFHHKTKTKIYQSEDFFMPGQ
jgi:hypothetical protein